MRTDTYRVVRADTASEAVNVEVFRKYLETRDFALLNFGPEATPEVFICRPLTVSERRAVRNCASLPDQYEAAFVRGVLAVENCLWPDGSRRKWLRPSDAGAADRPMPDDALRTYFDETTVQEIGMVVMRRSFLDPRRGHYYPLPDTSQSALTAILYRRAERIRGSLVSAETNAQANASTTQPQEPATSSPAGEGSTGATATV